MTTISQFYKSILLKYSTLIIGLVVIMMSCDSNNDPENETESTTDPKIKFINASFKHGNGTTDLDTISFSFTYEDPDGDAGQPSGIDLEPISVFAHKGNTITKQPLLLSLEDFELYLNAGSEDTGAKVITAGSQRELKLEKIPQASVENFCYEYERLNIRSDSRWIFPSSTKQTAYSVVDTFLVERTDNDYNVFIDYYEKTAEGSFKPFDVRVFSPFPMCNYRNSIRRLFPLIEEETPQTRSSNSYRMTGNARGGTITFYLLGQNYAQHFAGKQIQLRFYIKDAARHSSNIEKTTLLTFD